MVARIILALVALVGLSATVPILRSCAEADAMRLIESQGAAVSKPIPKVSVFVPQTGTDREKKFGDAQLKTIIPSLHNIRHFNRLSLSNSSVGDQSIRELIKVVELEALEVDGTLVTVDGLLALRNMPSLKDLRVGHEQFAPEEMKRLAAGFPNATISLIGRGPMTRYSTPTTRAR